MGNYDITTETREPTIQWIKVLLLTHSGREPTAAPPPPVGQIKLIVGCEILGKEIRMAGNRISAVEARIKKPNQTWKLVNRKFFRRRAFNPKTRILLRNSLIRSTMIYERRKRDPPRHLLGKVETYMRKHIRMMRSQRWKIDAWYPEKKTIYETLQQSAME